MITIAATDLKALALTKSEACVSIYMPLHGSQPDSKQDPIRFKNLLNRAEEVLLARGMRRPDISALLKEPRELEENALIWHADGRKGLAVLIEPGALRCLRSYESFDEIVRVGERFHLGPLVRAFADSGQFLLLAISANTVRLYRGDQHAFEPLLLPEGVPKNLKEVERGSQFDKGLQFHTSAPSSLAGAHVGIMHGHGLPKDDQKMLWTEYLRAVVSIWILFCTARRRRWSWRQSTTCIRLFREACQYHNLVSTGVTGSPDELSETELHRCALDAVRPALTSGKQHALDRYRELEATVRVAYHIETILPALEQGRVEVLFASREAHIWGRFEGENAVSLHRGEEPGDVDLLDLAISETIAKGGTAYVIDRNEVPSREPVAAILRW